jgi:predicted aminopeptidase
MAFDQQFHFRGSPEVFRSLSAVAPYFGLSNAEAMRIAVETFTCAAWLRMLDDPEIREREGEERTAQKQADLRARMDYLEAIAFSPYVPEAALN